MRKIVLLLCLVSAFCSSCSSAVQLEKYGVLIGAEPVDVITVKGYDTLVIDADYFTAEQIEALHTNGNKAVYSYLNVGALELFRKNSESYRHLTLDAYDNWAEEYWVNVASPDWQAHILAQAQQLANKGIDGLFLDNFDVYYMYNSEEVFDGLITILEELQNIQLPIIINGGDTFIKEALRSHDVTRLIYGVNQETVMTSIDFERELYAENDATTTQYYEQYLAICQAVGLAVYIIEYGAQGKLAKKIEKFSRKHNYNYFISPTLALDSVY